MIPETRISMVQPPPAISVLSCYGQQGSFMVCFGSDGAFSEADWMEKGTFSLVSFKTSKQFIALCCESDVYSLFALVT